jgi:hypothetical protein
MQAHELVLSLGDTVLVGDRELTVIDIDDDEVTFRVDSTDEELILSGGSLVPMDDRPPR